MGAESEKSRTLGSRIPAFFAQNPEKYSKFGKILKIRKITQKIRKILNNRKNTTKIWKILGKTLQKTRKNTPQKQDPGSKITFSNYGCTVVTDAKIT